MTFGVNRLLRWFWGECRNSRVGRRGRFVCRWVVSAVVWPLLLCLLVSAPLLPPGHLLTRRAGLPLSHPPVYCKYTHYRLPVLYVDAETNIEASSKGGRFVTPPKFKYMYSICNVHVHCTVHA